MSKLIDNMLLAAEVQANKVIIMQQEQLPPTWILINDKNEIQIDATPWANDFQREIVKRYIKIKMKKHKTVAYSFMSEAWAAKAPEGWQPGTPLPMRPMNNPARMECVIAFATDGKTKRGLTWEITRNDQEVAIALNLGNPSMDTFAMEGWISNLLYERVADR